MKEYAIALEISGPTAMWTRPDTGDSPVSYPVPTYSAAKAIFESVLWLKNAEVIPSRAEICSPLVFHTYTTNYGGPLRKSASMKKGASYQLLATVLVNVCYRLHAAVITDRVPEKRLTNKGRQYRSLNGAHAYKDIFERRIHRGQSFAVPFLGWKEFVPDYLGEFRSTTRICTEINTVLPSMLWQVFSAGKFTNWRPVYRQNVTIVNGVLDYAQ